MSISIYMVPIALADELVNDLLNNEFDIDKEYAKHIYLNYIKMHFDKLNDSIYLLAESKYVDKVYRDSYYHYYSSKLSNYKKDCLRISLFDGQISESDFWSIDKQKELQEKYRGFLVLRPTEPFVIGRSILSPKALKITNFQCCTTKFSTTANGFKFSIDGFPHSSQDTETISCAETTIWSIMEYFGHKYSEYTPILPSKIIQTLNKVSWERQIPSKGLDIQQMSFVLKDFGFGTRIYSRDEYLNEFDNLLSCYVESGIPIIIAMDNRPTGTIGHALLIIGHEKIQKEKIDTINPLDIFLSTDLPQQAKQKNIAIFDYDSINKKYVFIDDNQPAYQMATIENPAAHYPAEWQDCRITNFIVPLYTKIYLEAFEAKSFIIRFLMAGPEPLNNNSNILIRIYLASSRSFKNELATNDTFDLNLKGILLEKSMPKFIWVAEISNKDLFKNQMANGLIILDATEANILNNKPLILAAYQNKVVLFNETSKKIQSKCLHLNPFNVFQLNLNNF